MNGISESRSVSQSAEPVVGLARVMNGATSFKDAGIPNASDTYRGQILTHSGDLKSAIIKDIPAKELANEIMCAALANLLGLPSPPAFIAIASPNSGFSSHCPLSDGSSLMFASIDVGSPSLSQIVVSTGTASQYEIILDRIVPFIVKQNWLASLYGFDSWIANVDRHIGNILVGGLMGAWLIDHGRCFTGPNWSKADLVASMIFRNRLKEWLTPRIDSARRVNLSQDAAAMTDRFNEIDVFEVGINNNISELLENSEFLCLVNFLKDRIAFVPRAAGDALDQPMVA